MSKKLEDSEVRYVAENGVQVLTSISEVDVAAVTSGIPVRRVRSHASSLNYRGWFWSCTTGRHIVYESRLELDRLWLADFDPETVQIAAQPMWISGLDGSKRRRHVPDFLLVDRSGRVIVVDVKPEKFVRLPDVAPVLKWTEALCASRGWSYEVWTGSEQVRLANIRYLGGYRREALCDPSALDRVDTVAVDGMSIAEVEETAQVDGARAAVLAMIWSHTLTTDLSTPITPASRVSRSR